MKLIVETVNDVEILTEGKDDNKSLYIQGIFMQAETLNRNGRKYPLPVLRKEVNRYIKENISPKRAYGELNHPRLPTINLDRVSHMITDLKEDGNNFIGKAKIMDTPMGRIAKELIKEGANLGVSSRGLGSLKNSGNVNEVQSDFRLVTPADIVADPSAHDAFVNGIMEGVEFWINPKTGNVEEIDSIRSKMLNMNTRQIEEQKLNMFKAYLNSL